MGGRRIDTEGCGIRGIFFLKCFWIPLVVQWLRLHTPNARDLGSITGYAYCAQLLQSCPTLCDPMDCSLPGSSVHGILQVRILEGFAVPSSRGSSQSQDRTQDSYVFLSASAGGFFITSTIWKARIPGQGTRSHMPQLRPAQPNKQIIKINFKK